MATAAEPVPPAAPPLAAAWRIALPLALCLATLASFWPCTHQGFVDFDDDANFKLNYLFRGLGAEQLHWMWSGFHYGHWHPLTWLTFGVDYTFYGLDGAAYHRTTLVFHALAVLAFYALSLELLRWIAGLVSAQAPGPPLEHATALALHVCAALAALTWGLHPLRVESVAWATERRDVLSALFLALSALAYLRGARHGASRWRWLPLALAAFAASLLSKAWGITFPVVLLALDVFPLRRLRTRARAGLGWNALIVEKLLFVPFAWYAALQAVDAQRAIGATVSWAEHGVLQRAAQASYGLCFYVLKTLWPSDLSCLYLLELDFAPGRPVYVAAMLAVGVVTLGLLALARRFPAGIATWFVYGVLASPVLGLLQSGTQKVADRYAHVCSMALSIAFAGGVLVWLMRRPQAARGRALLAVGAASVVLALLLGFASNAQTRVWKDSESLFRRALAVEPHNYFVAHNLAGELYRRSAWSEAIEIEKRSVEAHPGRGNELARQQLGVIYRASGQLEAAQQAWRDAVEWTPAPDDPRWQGRPDYWLPDAGGCLAALQPYLAASGRVDEFVDLCERALVRRPDAVQVYTLLAQVYLQRGQFAKAVEMWRRAPRGSAAGAGVPAAVIANGLGQALLGAGNWSEAEKQLLQAVALDRYNREYVVDACELFFRQGRFQDVLSNLQQVLKVEPQHARANDLARRASAALGQR